MIIFRLDKHEYSHYAVGTDVINMSQYSSWFYINTFVYCIECTIYLVNTDEHCWYYVRCCPLANDTYTMQKDAGIATS